MTLFPEARRSLAEYVGDQLGRARRLTSKRKSSRKESAFPLVAGTAERPSFVNHSS